AFAARQNQAGREFDELVDTKLDAETAKRSPRGLAGESSHRERLAQAIEGPTASHRYRVVQSTFDAGTAGEVDAHQLQKRAESVAEAPASLGSLTADEEVRKEEPDDAEHERDPHGNDDRQRDAGHRR